jgi:hypothetical protein
VKELFAEEIIKKQKKVESNIIPAKYIETLTYTAYTPAHEKNEVINGWTKAE